jgi:hypothetical protein
MDRDVQIWQIIASATLALASVIVAAASALFSYRNNFGWKPTVILGRVGMQGAYVIDQIGRVNPPDEQPRYQVGISIEFWNRRKYPVVIRKMVLKAEGLDIVQEVGPVEGGWNYFQGRFSIRPGNSVAASSSDNHTVVIPHNVGDDPTKVRSPLRVTVDFYDPRLNRVSTIEVEEQYTIDGRLPLLPTSSNPQPELKDE